jgi:hypothetical protein
MIDFWEILGHTATDDTFRNAMYDKFAQSQAAPNPNTNNKFACLFANSDYDNARGLVVAKFGPVSLMALGEWFVVGMLHPLSRPILNAIAARTQALLNGYTSANKAFYQALGASIVDAEFSSEFLAQREGTYGFSLSANDRNALASVVGDGTFQLQAGKFHALDWTTGCKDMVIQSQGEPYAHALEVSFS